MEGSQEHAVLLDAFFSLINNSKSVSRGGGCSYTYTWFMFFTLVLSFTLVRNIFWLLSPEPLLHLCQAVDRSDLVQTQYRS